MKYALPIGVLLSAAAALAVEIIIVRIGAPYVGQSLLPWSAAIASVLLGMTAGHFCGGLIGGAFASIHRLRIMLAVAWLAAGLCALIAPSFAGPIASALFTDDGSDTMTVLAISALVLPASFAAGFSAPLAVRIALVMPNIIVPRMVGVIYAASAIGSVAGSAAAGFFLLETAGGVGSMRLVGGLWLLIALIAMPSRDLTVAHRRLAAVAVVAAIAALAAVRPYSPCLVESRYTCIQLIDKTLPEGGLVRLMELDEGIHSASDRDNPARLHFGYAALSDRLAGAAFAASGQPRALVIGGGGATLPRAWAASPASQVTVAELDATVAVLAVDAMWGGGLPNLRTVLGDGRAILRSLPQADLYDVILMDAYRTKSVPPHLVTAEFNAEVASRLTARGVFLSNIIDRTATPLLALSVARTLAQSFPAVDIWTMVDDREETTNVVVAAWKDPAIAFRPEKHSVVATALGANQPPLSRQMVWRRTDVRNYREIWPHACAALLTDDWAPVDRLLAGRPVCSVSSR